MKQEHHQGRTDHIACPHCSAEISRERYRKAMSALMFACPDCHGPISRMDIVESAAISGMLGFAGMWMTLWMFQLSSPLICSLTMGILVWEALHWGGTRNISPRHQKWDTSKLHRLRHQITRGGALPHEVPLMMNWIDRKLSPSS